MHLERAYLTTTQYNRKKKSSVRAQKAQAEHDAWLRKQGLHPEQLAAKKAAAAKDAKHQPKENTTPRQTMTSLASNEIPGSAPKRSVFDSEWKRVYDDDAMMARELASLKDSRDKAMRIAPLYSKGPAQFMTDGTDCKTVGRKI